MRIALAHGAWLEHDPAWLSRDEARLAFAALCDELAWEQREIVLFGRRVLQPRLIAWAGDLGYRYSGQTLEPRPFTPTAERLLERVRETVGTLFNHVLVNRYRDVLSLIEGVGSPAFKACMDINIEPEADSPSHAREMAVASRAVQVHSHMNGEFARRPDGSVELVAAGYFDKHFWGRQVAYPAYVDALVASGYRGYVDWEFCHPALENGKPAGIEYIHKQTRMALEYLSTLRAAAEEKARAATVG